MKKILLLLLTAASLTACATRSTLTSPPPVPTELLERCGGVVAEPLTTGDAYDLARALSQAIGYGRDCRKRMNELASAVEARQQIMNKLTEPKK